MKYILSIDQGTSSSRAIIYNTKFEVVGVGQEEFPQHFPQAGWVEHDLEEIWTSVKNSVVKAIEVASNKDKDFSDRLITCIGITNQRETFGLWNKKTGAPLRNAIVWQCRRSEEICSKLSKSSAGKKVARDAGLVLDPYFSGTKLKWVLDKEPKIKKLAKEGKASFGTIDTYLIYRLGGKRDHVTDTTNASRTLLMDLKKTSWSQHALKTLGVPEGLLPKILSSNSCFTKTQGLDFLPDGIPVSGVLGDQQAALFGQGCFKKGESKVTYGTGSFMLINTGAEAKKSKNGVSTVAWQIGNKVTYALESSVFIAGAAVQWLRDGLQMISSSSEVEELAKSVKTSDGVFFVPALSGLGSPYWAPKVRGTIGGLSRGSSKAHVARACLEGIAHSVGDVFSGLQKDAGLKAKSIRVDGGASRNELMMQYQADLLRVEIKRPVDVETTVRGAAYMAALGAGIISNISELGHAQKVDKSFKARIKPVETRKLKDTWSKKIKKLIELY